MSASEEATEIARVELIPILKAVCASTREEGSLDQAAFFGRILLTIENAREEADLADAFIELSTSAFRGFSYSPSVAMLLDRVLELSHRLSMTLSAPTEQAH